MTRPTFEIAVGGLIVDSYIRATLTRTLGSLAMTGQFTALDDGEGPLPFAVGEAASISIDGTEVLDGFVRGVNKPTSAGQSRINVTISSRSTDLTECSVDRGSFRKATPRSIAKALVADYGMRVLGNDVAMDKPLPKFVVRPGEKVAQALKRLGDKIRLMVTSDGLDGVVFTQAVDRSTPPIRSLLGLTPVGNVFQAQLRLADRAMFSPIIVRGQSRGSNNAYGDKIRGATATVEDPNVTRHRPLVIQAPGRKTDLEAHAEWERARRFGESQSLRHSVLGFSHVDGPWEVNRLVSVVDQPSRVRDPLLITAVTFTSSASAARTSLTLSRVEAFLPAPPPRLKKGKGL